MQLLFLFRTGYATYLAFLIGLINIMTTTYFLVIDRIPFLTVIFPTFEAYAVIAVLVGAPIIVVIGWIHMKRLSMYSAEANVGTEENPYNYKYAVGFTKEVFGPMYAMMVKMMIKRVTGEGLTDEEIRTAQKIDDDLTKLISGGFVGKPSKGAY